MTARTPENYSFDPSNSYYPPLSHDMLRAHSWPGLGLQGNPYVNMMGLGMNGMPGLGGMNGMNPFANPLGYGMGYQPYYSEHHRYFYPPSPFQSDPSKIADIAGLGATLTDAKEAPVPMGDDLYISEDGEGMRPPSAVLEDGGLFGGMLGEEYHLV